VGVARFVFLSGPGVSRIADRVPTGGVIWALVAPNNRTLGRGGCVCENYSSCRDAAAALQSDIARADTRTSTDPTGQFVWEIYVDGAAVARSHRSFLRARECDYNLDRFRAVLPAALITTGVRVLRNGRVTHVDQPR
jgi:hypothetical protein